MMLLSHSFYNRSPLLVAPDLLGKVFVRRLDAYILSGRITEVEAYLGANDPASHACAKKTARTASLYKDAGHAYIHRIHMHHCFDIVTEGPDVPSSVLIRALLPLEGIEHMKAFRNKDRIQDLASGPGKLTQALQITKQLDGIDLTDPNAVIAVFDDGYRVQEVFKSQRIGISKAVDELYRFFVR